MAVHNWFCVRKAWTSVSFTWQSIVANDSSSAELY